jgi:lipopolysaccharide export system protein LptC
MMASVPPVDATATEDWRHRFQAARGHIGWTVQSRETVLDVQRYTYFVMIMKRALLLAAGALLFAVLAYALQPREVSQYAMTFERMGRVANDLAMIKPRLTGSDSDGNPFVITADQAIQDEHDIHKAQLFNVEADVSGKDSAWYNLRAPRGLLETGVQKLWLSGNLALFTDSGYELHTDAAFVDLAPTCDAVTGRPPAPRPGKAPPRCAKTTVRGDHVVTGQGPLGTLRADRFHIEKASKHVFLDGHVRMVLYPAQRSGRAKTARFERKK